MPNAILDGFLRLPSNFALLRSEFWISALAFKKFDVDMLCVMRLLLGLTV